MTGYHESNFSLAYSSHLSWQSPDSPVPIEVYPSLAWDNLFDNRGSLQNIGVSTASKTAPRICPSASVARTRASSMNT